MTSASPVEPLPYEAAAVEEALGPGWSELLRSAYRWMILGRTLDAHLETLQREGRVDFLGAAPGHEAVNVAAGLASAREDWVFPGLREQLVALVRGHPLPTYVHHLFADAKDPAVGRNVPGHPTAREVHYVSMSSVIGTQLTQAVGLAYAQKLRAEAAATLVFFGDGATSSNDFHAGLNFAGVFHLPVVFCCVNNQWAISVPVSRQTAAASLASKGAAYGLPGRQVDGTDFVASFRALATALKQARSGEGPVLLEFVLYRMTPRSEIEDVGRYQPADWMTRAARLDPVNRLLSWLQSHGQLTEGERSQWEADAEREVRAAIELAEGTPPPPAESATEDVYASRPYAPPGSGG
ncbi:MAG TPA: thiamine pyrophosphate-dependent enzyme [Thermoplasmata archaeon]|jgi:2-oxoisovalerate dehydrogenase E1 component alpha subunit